METRVWKKPKNIVCLDPLRYPHKARYECHVVLVRKCILSIFAAYEDATCSYILFLPRQYNYFLSLGGACERRLWRDWSSWSMSMAQVTLSLSIPQSTISTAGECPHGTCPPTPSSSLANRAGPPPAHQCDTLLMPFSPGLVFKPAMAFSGIQRVPATTCQAICQ